MITAGARVRVVDMLAINLSDLLEGQKEAMHGDEVDTSIMLYLAPHLVHQELARDYMMSREQLRRYRRGTFKVPSASAGSIGRPSMASAEKGPHPLRAYPLQNQRSDLSRACPHGMTARVKLDSGCSRTAS